MAQSISSASCKGGRGNILEMGDPKWMHLKKKERASIRGGGNIWELGRDSRPGEEMILLLLYCILYWPQTLHLEGKD